MDILINIFSLFLTLNAVLIIALCVIAGRTDEVHQRIMTDPETMKKLVKKMNEGVDF